MILRERLTTGRTAGVAVHYEVIFTYTFCGKEEPAVL